MKKIKCSDIDIVQQAEYKRYAADLKAQFIDEFPGMMHLLPGADAPHDIADIDQVIAE